MSHEPAAPTPLPPFSQAHVPAGEGGAAIDPAPRGLYQKGRMLEGSSILITGGTGSFGQSFVRSVLRRCSPRRLVIFSRDEQKQFRMAQEFPPEEHRCLRYFIGDVRDEKRLKRAMQGVEYVIHAAAMKHVPIAEYNPFECIRTNIGGAENVIEAAIDCGVKRVIALSTDKAANPINLYGATKLASDKCFVAANHLSASSETRFSVVRYGNVLGSRGSVIEYFQKLYDQGTRQLPITHDEMTRFWISLKQAVQFVLDRLEDMHGGEIFVPKHKSSTLQDLVSWLWPDCDTKPTGIRPGEKLHEVLIPFDEGHNTLRFDDYFAVFPTLRLWNGGQTPGGERVGHNFNYRSSDKEWRLTREELVDMLAHDV